MIEPMVPVLRGAFSLAVVTLSTLVVCIPLFAISLIKWLIPLEAWRARCGKVLTDLAQWWVGINSLGLDLTKTIHWDIEGVEGLSREAWYLLMANHQTMVDIVVLQKVFHRRIPMLKFFIKRELLWVPVLGVAWWALDFPFMRRTSSTERDLATARTACDKFSAYPVTVMNFVEGTRFTEAKREKQGSPYRHLLRPKAGGITVVLDRIGRQIRSILDVTIIYPQGAPGLWSFLCSKSMEIKVRVRQLPVADDLSGNLLEEESARQRLNGWLNSLWKEKDDTIERLISPSTTASDPNQSPPV